MTDSQWIALKVGDRMTNDTGDIVTVVSLRDDFVVECSCDSWEYTLLEYITNSQWYTLLDPVTPPQPHPLRFVQLLGTAEGGLSYALGNDGVIYDHRGDWDAETQKHYQWWEPLNIPSSREAALEALRLKQGETP